MTTTVTVTVAGHQVAVTERRVTEGENNTDNVDDTVTALKVSGETRTFYAQNIHVEELPDASESAVDQLNTGGSARELTDDDFEKHGLEAGIKG